MHLRYRARRVNRQAPANVPCGGASLFGDVVAQRLVGKLETDQHFETGSPQRGANQRVGHRVGRGIEITSLAFAVDLCLDIVGQRRCGARNIAPRTAAPDGAGLAIGEIEIDAADLFRNDQITALHDRAAREAARAERIDWFGMALSVASLATDVASISKRETPAQYQSRAAIHDAAITYSAVSAATKIEHAVAAEVMQARAANLQNYALRKVTLEPGQQVRGYLYFPRYDAADGFVVRAPVGSSIVPLEFTQTRVRR